MTTTTKTTRKPRTPKHMIAKLDCPCCGRNTKHIRHEKEVQIWVCQGCDAIHGEIYLGDSYALVKPYMDNEPSMEGTRYFDFTCLGSTGITRRHGWYRKATGLIAQVG